MQHIRKPKGNNSACVGLAFAMAAGLTWEEMVKLVGHDGTEMFGGYPVGFHPQEILFKLRTKPSPVKFCEYHLVPASTIKGKVYRLTDEVTTRLERFKRWINETRGVVRMMVPGEFFVHAVAYDKGMIYDSSLKIPCKYNQHPLIQYPTEIYIMES